ncbi:MAG: hypothetical protein AABY22_23915, partial [Nanoarchaeota archaeon]
GTNYAKVSVNDADDLLDKITENLYEWHTTLGEGKVNFMERGVFENNYCLLGTLMAFDDGVQKMMTDSNLRYLDIYQKMSEKKTDKDTSYLREIYGRNKAEELVPLDPNNKKFTDGLIVPSQTQVVVSRQIETGIGGGIAWGAGAALTVFGIALAIPSGGTSLALTATGLALTGGTGYYVYYESKPNPDEDYAYVAPQLSPYNKEVLDILKCSSFESLAGDVTP